jgi:hypothetical protein
MADVKYEVEVAAEATGFDDAASAAESLANEATGASDALEDLSDAADEASGSTEGLADSAKGMDLGKLKSGFADIGGPLGGFASKLVGAKEGAGKLTEVLGSTGGSLAVVATGAAMAAVAILAVAAAVGAAIVGIAAWGVSLASANRDLALTYEGLALTDPALEGLASTAANVSNATGVSQDKLQGFAKQLSAAGVSAADMETALKAVATAEGAVAGAGAKVIEEIKGGGAALDEVAAKANETYGGLMAKKMMSLGAQSDRLKGNIGQIFGGLNIEPVLAGFATLVGIFDSTSATGQTMKWIFESLFQPLLDAVPAAAQMIEAFVLGVMIGGLKLYIAFKPAINAVKELVAAVAGGGGGDIDWMATITSAAEYLAPVIMVGVGAFAALAVGVGAAIAMAMAVPMAIMAIIGVVGSLLPAIMNFVGGMLGAGKDLMLGLAKGITEGGAAVLGAITGAVGGAINSAKSLLGIASPSKVFAAIGEQTSEGMAIGIERNDAPLDAMSAMVEPPSLPQGGTASTSNTKSMGNITININAPSGDAQSIAEAVRAALRDILDDDAMMMGAA